MGGGWVVFWVALYILMIPLTAVGIQKWWRTEDEKWWEVEQNDAAHFLFAVFWPIALFVAWLEMVGGWLVVRPVEWFKKWQNRSE